MVNAIIGGASVASVKPTEKKEELKKPSSEENKSPTTKPPENQSPTENSGKKNIVTGAKDGVDPKVSFEATQRLQVNKPEKLEGGEKKLESSPSEEKPKPNMSDNTAIDTHTPNEDEGQNAKKTTVFLIDDFLPETDQKDDKGNAFNHGETMAQIIQTGAPSSKPTNGQNNPIEVVKYNVDDPKSTKSRTSQIADGLDEAYQRYARGEDIDSVNLSQSAKEKDAETDIINAKIKKLTDKNIPVVVAAGNDGPDKPNPMATDSSIIVQNALLGTDKVASKSGPGNIVSEGKYTSHATANVSREAAILHNQGKKNDEVKATLDKAAVDQGGALDTKAGSNDPIFTTPDITTVKAEDRKTTNPNESPSNRSYAVTS